jgi:hypothetical protein
MKTENGKLKRKLLPFVFSRRTGFNDANRNTKFTQTIPAAITKIASNKEKPDDR